MLRVETHWLSTQPCAKAHDRAVRENKGAKAKGQEKAYQFMLRLKVPGGEVPGPIFKKLDELCMEYGQGDLRITTRQAFQLHGVMKNTLGTVIKTIMEAGSKEELVISATESCSW